MSRQACQRRGGSVQAPQTDVCSPANSEQIANSRVRGVEASRLNLRVWSAGGSR